ncbi:MAG TPA: tRNA pseudouridine(38-40) synthase TruA [candidate division Zixibacteria bacterium]|nr:tRNA pseudouridine(38-40) synthase TruA [candidate division Zixibacteria bacterium]
MNIKLTLEYDGTNYHGWQLQPNGVSVQAVVEKAVATFLGAPARVTAAGRTDAGVHALGQVANFVTDRNPDLGKLQKGLNALTPRDIVIREVEHVPDSFDARRDARSREYRYRIWNRPWPSPFECRYAWHVHDPLDLEPMREAIAALEGEHDFSSFQAAGCEAAHAVRRIFSNSLEREDGVVVYRVEATAFLRHMVRNIVGTLVEVGRGERTPAEFVRLLEARDRRKAGRTAPAHGLFLTSVRY